MEDQNNLIRIIMITHNGAKFIDQQLDSIIEQPGVECIKIHDDYSSQEFIKKLKLIEENKEAIIELCLNQKNLGVVANIKNALMSNLDAKYIALSDQDDLWHAHKMERFRKELLSLNSSPDIPILVYSDMRVIDGQGTLIRRSFWSQFGYDKFHHSLNTLLFGNFVTGCASGFNTALAKYIHTMPEYLNSYHDHWLAIAAFTFGKTKRIDQPFNDYRIHGENQAFYSTKKSSIIDRRLQNLKYLVTPEKHMKNQFEIADAFYQIYKQEMNEDKKFIIQEFLRIGKSSYIQQKLYRRRVFNSHNIHRIQ